MQRKYICTNGVVEVTRYTVGDKTEPTGGKWRRAKNQDDKRDENARQAIRVAARILNCNFTPEDHLVTLTYSDESWDRLFAGMDPDECWDAAKKAAASKLDQIRKAAKRKNIEMRTLCVTADMDQETGELVRVHHHVVVTAKAAELLHEKWGYGLVHTEHLYSQDDYTPMAAYLLGQVRHMENRKKYSCSRNMVQPKVEEMVLDKNPDNEIKVQPGAKVLDRTPYREGVASQYVRYKRKPATRKRGGHKQFANNGGLDTPPALRATSPVVGEDMSGGSEFCENESAEGGSGNELSEITRG